MGRGEPPTGRAGGRNGTGKGWGVDGRGRVGGRADLPEQRASLGDTQRSCVFQACEKECEELCVLAPAGLIWDTSEGRAIWP